MKTRLSILVLTCCLASSQAFAQQVIQLYEGQPKGSENWTWSEQISTQNQFGVEVIYNVTQPTLTAYLPDPQIANGTAVIVAPGGAFHILSINSEGVEVAKWLNGIGVAAFVLKYRLARSMTTDPVKELTERMQDFDKLDAVNEPIIPLAMADGHAAVKHVREHAGAYNIDPDRIGFIGFSAGGTLTMSVAYNSSEENRPNFIAPIYPYEKAILGSAVPKAKTPIFVAVAGDDGLGFVPHAINIYKKMVRRRTAGGITYFRAGRSRFRDAQTGPAHGYLVRAFRRMDGVAGIVAGAGNTIFYHHRQ